MTESSAWWVELRYTSSQPLPGSDGIRDELDGIVWWTVEAVQCFHDSPEQVVARSDVAVFDLEAGIDLEGPASAYGGRIRTAAELLLTREGTLQADLPYPDVDKVVLFLQVVIGQGARGRGLAATNAVRDRVASRRSLVACLPDPPAVTVDAPEFFHDVDASVQQAWWDRGLTYRGSGLWLLPPDPD